MIERGFKDEEQLREILNNYTRHQSLTQTIEKMKMKRGQV